MSKKWLPTSKRSPYFNRDTLERALAGKGIGYVRLREGLLGYRREGLGEVSPNKARGSRGFRNYADHALSEEFKKGVEKLLHLAETGRTAIMCAEKHYWRCHRRIISDHLAAWGIEVVHIVERGKTRRHRFTSFAVVEDGAPTYPLGRGDETAELVETGERPM